MSLKLDTEQSKCLDHLFERPLWMLHRRLHVGRLVVAGLWAVCYLIVRTISLVVGIMGSVVALTIASILLAGEVIIRVDKALRLARQYTQNKMRSCNVTTSGR